MLDKTEQSDRISNPNEKPESCYCSALPKGSGPCLPCFTRWPAGGVRNQSGLALPTFACRRALRGVLISRERCVGSSRDFVPPPSPPADLTAA
jgi:hypothetical protein